MKAWTHKPEDCDGELCVCFRGVYCSFAVGETDAEGNPAKSELDIACGHLKESLSELFNVLRCEDGKCPFHVYEAAEDGPDTGYVAAERSCGFDGEGNGVDEAVGRSKGEVPEECPVMRMKKMLETKL